MRMSWLAVVLTSLLWLAGASHPAGAQTDETPAELQERAQEAQADLMASAVGAPARVDLLNQAHLRLTGTYQFIPRDAAIPWMSVNGRTVPSDLVGVILEGGVQDWFAVLRFIDEGHVPEAAIRRWSADDLLLGVRELITRENQRNAANGREERRVTGWLVPPAYFPEQHLLTWSALTPTGSVERERDSQAEQHIVVFGRDGYFHLEASATAGLLRERQRHVMMLMENLRFADGRRYQDYVPGTDPVLAQGVQRVMELPVLRKSTLFDGDWDTDNLLILAVGATMVMGAGLLAVARLFTSWWRLRR